MGGGIRHGDGEKNKLSAFSDMWNEGLSIIYGRDKRS